MKRITLITALALFYSLALTAQDQQVRFFSHRGGRMEFDENTMEAFEASYRAGYRGYETDVKMTRDGVFVINHDNSLKRVTGVDCSVEDLTADEVRKIRTLKGNNILFLDELLDWLRSKGDIEYVEFELKTNQAKYPDDKIRTYCDALYKAVMTDKPAGAAYVFTSGDYRGLRYMTTTYPDGDYLLITGHPCREDSIELCKSMGIKRLGATIGGTSRDAVRRAHEAGLIVSLWPGQSIADAILGVYLGADYLCTDIPLQIKEFFETRMPLVNAEF